MSVWSNDHTIKHLALHSTALNCIQYLVQKKNNRNTNHHIGRTYFSLYLERCDNKIVAFELISFQFNGRTCGQRAGGKRQIRIYHAIGGMCRRIYDIWNLHAMCDVDMLCTHGVTIYSNSVVNSSKREAKFDRDECARKNKENETIIVIISISLNV